MHLGRITVCLCLAGLAPVDGGLASASTTSAPESAQQTRAVALPLDLSCERKTGIDFSELPPLTAAEAQQEGFPGSPQATAERVFQGPLMASLVESAARKGLPLELGPGTETDLVVTTSMGPSPVTQFPLSTESGDLLGLIEVAETAPGVFVMTGFAKCSL